MSLPPHIQPFDTSPLNVRLWRVNLDVNLAAGDLAMLSAAEQDRAARFRFERDARRYGASHVALRQVLAHALGLADPAQIDYAHNAHGKPQLATGGLHFNMSHSGDWALIGISTRHALGVDLEVCKPMPDASDLAQRHFTPAEYAAYLASPLDQREATFLRCWTRKEACLKALGSGLSIEPRGFEAGIHPDIQVTTIVSPTGPCQIEVSSLTWPTHNDAAYAAVARWHTVKR